jgi:hypothetical protein
MANPLPDAVTLRCLGNVDGPRFLRGLVRGNHGVRLVTLLGHGNDTEWGRSRQGNKGQFWTLDCRGRAPDGVTPTTLYLFGLRGGKVIIDTLSPGDEPELWHARPTPGLPPAVTLENIALRDAGVDARFLDGRTKTGEVGLAPNTGPAFTGTRWEVGHVAGTGQLFTGGR